MEKLVEKESIEKLKDQWRKLWRERIDDKVRAEGIANSDYCMLFVDKGTVIFATRNFKMLNFREILESHGVVNAERLIPANPLVGGWGKFIKTIIISQKPGRRFRRAQQYVQSEKQSQQLKKGGRGWLHY